MKPPPAVELLFSEGTFVINKFC